MAEKEYYTSQEAMEKLGMTEDQLRSMVREGKLREFRFSGKIHFKASEIDALGPQGTSQPSDLGTDTGSEIELKPAELSDSGSVLPLEETGVQETPAKPPEQGKQERQDDESVSASGGVSLFDEDELSGLEADPMAKTQIAPTVGGELSLEGGGSGSGLLDLTRESDDTSLGAELLDEIYSEDQQPPSGESRAGTIEAPAEEFQPAGEEEPVIAAAPRAPVAAAPADPMAAMFNGLMIVATILLGVTGAVVAAMVQGVLPWYVQILSQNILFWLIGSVVLVAATAGIGFVLSRR